MHPLLCYYYYSLGIINDNFTLCNVDVTAWMYHWTLVNSKTRLEWNKQYLCTYLGFFFFFFFFFGLFIIGWQGHNLFFRGVLFFLFTNKTRVFFKKIFFSIIWVFFFFFFFFFWLAPLSWNRPLLLFQEVEFFLVTNTYLGYCSEGKVLTTWLRLTYVSWLSSSFFLAP